MADDSPHGPFDDPGFAYARLESAYVPTDGEFGWGEGLKPQTRDYKVTTEAGGSAGAAGRGDGGDRPWPAVQRTKEDWSVDAETAAWRFRAMHYTTLGMRHGFSKLDGVDKRDKHRTIDSNETIDRWMAAPLNLSVQSQVFSSRKRSKFRTNQFCLFIADHRGPAADLSRLCAQAAHGL